MFYFLHKLKQRPVNSDVTEGAITTRSDQMKFRLPSQKGLKIPGWWPGRGVLPYISYIGMCHPIGWGFCAVLV